jgi:CPA2 family monovalent cation:H+ antiporter-2
VDHQPLLISTIAVGLTAAFAGGLVARKARIPPIVGYLLAGVVVGPFTPGFIADTDVAAELAEIGVILLMFGVGIHFSIRDLLAVRGIALPGAIGQITVATAFGIGLGLALGWGIGGAVVLGLALSVASTVVLLRALMDRHELDSVQGRIAVGWLIVEDLFTVAVLVLLPAIAPLLGGTTGTAGSLDPFAELAIALAKAVVFAVLMIVVGARFVPWLLVLVAREGSRELFTLGVLAIALGIAFASSAIFGVSLALGAFLAGALVGESDLSHQAAADALPLQDAFAVLFFVSVGMLVDPAFLLAHPIEIVGVVALIIVAKSLAAFAIVLGLGYPVRIALTVAAALAQIGEFSFILATLGLSLGLLPPEGYQLLVAGSLISITLNPVLFAGIAPLDARLRDHAGLRRLLEGRRRDLRALETPGQAHQLTGHAILAGYGRVGRIIAGTLERRGFRYVVITNDRREVEARRGAGGLALYGDASQPELLKEAGIERARMIIAAINEPHATRLIVDRARQLNPRIDVITRTHSEGEAARLRSAGPSIQPVFGERELAVQMLRYALRRFGVSSNEVELIAQSLRRQGGPPTGARPRAGRRDLERIRSWFDRRWRSADRARSTSDGAHQDALPDRATKPSIGSFHGARPDEGLAPRSR